MIPGGKAYCAVNVSSGKLSFVFEQEKDFKASVPTGIDLS